MDQTITLRHLGPDDLALVMGVREGLFDNPVREDQATRFLSTPLHDMVVAMTGADVVGMASGNVLFHPDKPPAYFINEVGVRDRFQRRGIGTALCNALKEIAEGHGCEGIWLATEGANGPARALYRSMEARETTDVVVYDWNDRALDGV